MAERASAPINDLGVSFPVRRLVLASELYELGFPPQRIARAVEQGSIHRLRRGIYLDSATWQAASAALRSVYLLAAFQRTMPGPVLFSHSSAARLHGLYLWDEPELVHIIQPFNVGAAKTGESFRSHRLTVPADQTVSVRGLRATSLERTVLDCCRTMELRRALVLADHALRKGARLSLLQQEVDGGAGSRGIRNVRRVFAMADGRSESPGESLTRLHLTNWALPMPELQYSVLTRRGSYRADFAWPELRLILEFDGDAKYYAYRPTSQALVEERKREKALMEQGWSFIRIEWTDLFNERQLKARILAAMDQARRRQAAA